MHAVEKTQMDLADDTRSDRMVAIGLSLWYGAILAVGACMLAELARYSA